MEHQSLPPTRGNMKTDRRVDILRFTRCNVNVTCDEKLDVLRAFDTSGFSMTDNKYYVRPKSRTYALFYDV